MEEIIIDGVDVAGCCYYEPKNDTGEWCDLTCTRDNAPVFRCEKMPICYYKQLKRLEFELKVTKADYEASEQENAELKAKIKKYAAINEQETKDYAELKAENERLKAEVESLQYNMAVYSMKDIDNAAILFAKDKAILEQKCALLEAYKNKYYQQTLDDEIKINELHQTLQEIKEIAERNIFLNPKLLEINGNIGQIQNIAITQILDLITKAEEE